ncbi:hypothetical protein BJ741DRAFT_693386 [Chytriomyces cf. hyalinus JEL632]|nr:hypothetical protein BJ741DRAFT_693386 [Chytriomyces cf. hyalinus JEL632]
MSNADRTKGLTAHMSRTPSDIHLQEWDLRSMTAPRTTRSESANASNRKSETGGTGDAAQESSYRFQRSSSSISPPLQNHSDGNDVGRKLRATDLRKRLVQGADASASLSSSQNLFDNCDQSNFSFDSNNNDDNASRGSIGSNCPVLEPKLESSHSSLSSMRGEKLSGIEDLGRKILTSNLLQKIEQHGSMSSIGERSISSMDSASQIMRRPARFAEDSPRSSCESSSVSNNSSDAVSSNVSYISIPCINPFDHSQQSSISSLDSVEIQVRYYDLTGLKVNASEIRRIIALEQATATLPSSNNNLGQKHSTTPLDSIPSQESPQDSKRLSIADIKHRQFPKLSKSPCRISPAASEIGFSTIQESTAPETQPVESQAQDSLAVPDQHNQIGISHSNSRQSVNVFINQLIHRKKDAPDGTAETQLLSPEGNKGKLVKGILKARSAVNISTEREIDKIRSSEDLDKPRQPKIKWFKSLVTGKKII